MADDDPSFYAADFNTGEGTNYLVILLAENFAPPAVLRRVAGPRVHVAAVSHKRTLCGRAALRFRKATREWSSRSLKMEKILARRYMNVRGKLPRFVNCRTTLWSFSYLYVEHSRKIVRWCNKNVQEYHYGFRIFRGTTFSLHNFFVLKLVIKFSWIDESVIVARKITILYSCPLYLSDV